MAIKQGLLGFLRKAATFFDLPAPKNFMAAEATFTYMPLCDKASGSLALLRRGCWQIEHKIAVDATIGGWVLCWPGGCGRAL